MIKVRRGVAAWERFFNFFVKAKSQFKRRSTANNVEITIPVPSDADSPKFKVSRPRKNRIFLSLKFSAM